MRKIKSLKKSKINKKYDDKIFPRYRKRPHPCPICHGKGRVQGNFYDNVGTLLPKEECRSCYGVGIVWG